MDEKLKPVTPGELLLEEFLVPMGITKYRLAKEIGVPAQRIGEIVGRQPALRLARLSWAMTEPGRPVCAGENAPPESAAVTPPAAGETSPPARMVEIQFEAVLPDRQKETERARLTGALSAELAQMHRSVPTPPPSHFNANIPPALEQIILKVLSKEPSARYRTADQLGRVLMTFNRATTVSPVVEAAQPPAAAATANSSASYSAPPKPQPRPAPPVSAAPPAPSTCRRYPESEYR